MIFYRLKSLCEANLEEANEVINWYAQETEISEERVVEILKLELLAEILYEIQQDKAQRAYDEATTKAGREEIMEKFFKLWN